MNPDMTGDRPGEEPTMQLSPTRVLTLRCAAAAAAISTAGASLSANRADVGLDWLTVALTVAAGVLLGVGGYRVLVHTITYQTPALAAAVVALCSLLSIVGALRHDRPESAIFAAAMLAVYLLTLRYAATDWHQAEPDQEL